MRIELHDLKVFNPIENTAGQNRTGGMQTARDSLVTVGGRKKLLVPHPKAPQDNLCVLYTGNYCFINLYVQ